MGFGLIGSAVSWTIVGTHYRSTPTESRASYEARQAKVDAVTPWAYTTTGIAISGLALVTTGWVWMDGRVQLGLGPGGSPGLTVQVIGAGRAHRRSR